MDPLFDEDFGTALEIGPRAVDKARDVAYNMGPRQALPAAIYASLGRGVDFELEAQLPVRSLYPLLRKRYQ